MRKKIRFAIVGTSSISHFHIKAIQNNPLAKVVYIYSRSFSRSKKLAKKYGVVAADSYAMILKDKTIDAVDIVTEPHRHARLALEAIRHRKHVLIEKPLDINLKLAKKVVEEAERAKTFTSVISQRRFDSILVDIKRRYEEGEIGNSFFAEAKMILRRPTEYYKEGDGWRGKYGNVLMNQAIHWIDIALWFFGTPKKVYGLTKKINKKISCYDAAICCLEFPNNIIFNLVCSTSSHKNQPEEFRIYGEKGILDYIQEKNKIFRFIKNLAKMPFRLSLHSPSPLKKQIDNFIDSIKYQRKPAVSVSEAYKVLKIIKECERMK